MLFIPREASSEIYSPRVSSLSYLPSRSIFIRFYFQIYYSKIPKIPCCNFILFNFALPQDLFIRSTTNQSIFYPGGIDNLSYASGYKYLFFVCRYRLHSVVWFSYWFDNLGLITEGNTYRHCAASSLPLWGNTDAVQAMLRCRVKHTVLPPRSVVY